MTLRHFFTFNKVKPQLSDYLEAWETYKKVGNVGYITFIPILIYLF